MRPLFATICMALSVMASAHGATIDDTFAAAANERADLAPLIIEVSQLIPTLPPGEALALVDRVAPFCRQIFNQALPTDESAKIGLMTHHVAPGETPTAIARRYRCSVELIAQLNPGFDAHGLQVDQTLTVFDLASVPLEIIVSRSAYRMMLWRGPHVIGVFRCGLGRDSARTPIGTTTVAMCVRNPEWRDPDTGKIFKPHDKGNVLGGYWIGFDHGPTAHFKGIGIHGFTAESPDVWLEKNGSHGCVRLTQEDIPWAFDLIRPGIRVTIRE
jgi:lipoprotein-anchoring transpeptidase ErfK/SrfK